ncbi:DNA primase domain protein [Mycobacterium xenopi 4042]|uniref:DNA primase domain protein n=1 Tax=Mycobacterium xenopi 4042 TaxID=1299334 RepID=X8AQU7_MYCXE|nr:DNA primase domain protein [Mycobacterium xenopi 4042]
MWVRARGWDSLTKHLLRKGFDFKELEAAGLSRQGRRGPSTGSTGDCCGRSAARRAR